MNAFTSFHLKYVKLGIEKDLEKHSKRDYSDYRSWVWRDKSKVLRDRDGLARPSFLVKT